MLFGIILATSLLSFCSQVADGVPFRSIVSTVDWLTSLGTDLRSNLLRETSQHDDSSWEYGDENFFITGTTSGIGREIAYLLLSKCRKLTLHCRPSKLLGAEQLFARSDSSKFNFTMKMVGIDLSKVNTIPKAINSLDMDPIDTLIHNAGLMSADASVKDIINVNCISPFVLSLSTLPRIMSSTKKNPKILYISSSSHIRGPKYVENKLQRSYLLDDRASALSSLKAYAAAKYCSILLTLALKRRLRDTDIQIINIHPGLVNTPMLRSFCHLPAFLSNKILSTPREAASEILKVLKKVDSGQNCLYFVRSSPAMDRLSRFISKYNEDKEIDAADEVECLYRDILKSLPKSTLIDICKCLDTPTMNPKGAIMSATKLQVEHVDAKANALKLIKNDVMEAMHS